MLSDDSKDLTEDGSICRTKSVRSFESSGNIVEFI